MRSSFETWLLTGLALSVLGTAPVWAAGLTISASSVTVAPGSTGDSLEVDLTNSGSTAVVVGGFDFEIFIANTAVSFSDVNTATSMTYVFSGNSLFGPDLTGPNSGQTISASDVAFTPFSGTTLASGATVGLGRVTFNVAAGAAAGTFEVNFVTYPSTSVSDALGGNVNLGTYSDGNITIFSGAPEPSSLSLWLCLAVVALLYRLQAKRRKFRF